MSFISFFGKVGKILISPATAQRVEQVGAYVAPVNPGLGALIEMIGSTAYSIEQQVGAAVSGAQKKEHVKAVIDTAAPIILDTLARISGKPVDVPAVAPILDRLIDDVVAAYNALGIFSHQASAPQQLAPGFATPTKS